MLPVGPDLAVGKMQAMLPKGMLLGGWPRFYAFIFVISEILPTRLVGVSRSPRFAKLYLDGP